MRDASIGIRVKPDLKDWLQARADQERRSLSNVIEGILEDRRAAEEPPAKRRKGRA